jgi:hypothetical protein
MILRYRNVGAYNSLVGARIVDPFRRGLYIKYIAH